jgi:hypothetical protein
MGGDVNIQKFDYRIHFLAREIEQELTDLMPDCTLPTPGTWQYEELWKKLGYWKLQIDLVARDIAGASRMSDLAASRILSVPRSQRYSVRQSVVDRKQNILDSLQAVMDLRSSLDKLLQRCTSPTLQELIKLNAEIFEKFHEMAEDRQKAVQELGLLVMPPSAVNIQKPQSVSAPQDILVTLTVVGRILQLLVMRIAKSIGNN